eukprot:jgi/Chrzof1/2841/Cz12g00230.t1
MQIEAKIANMVVLGNTPVNTEQKAAIATLLTGGGRSLPYMLFGPPGTGKTITLVEAVLQIRQAYPSRRILCCAPLNFSADLICSALAAAGVPVADMCRLNDPRLPVVQAKADVLPYCLLDPELNSFILPKTHKNKDSCYRALFNPIIIASCTTAGLLRHNHISVVGAPMHFHYVFIDEAGQALLPEALVPMTLALSSDMGGAIMLVGDPKQLGPVVRCGTAAAHGLGSSLLDLFVDYHHNQRQQGNSSSSSSSQHTTLTAATTPTSSHAVAAAAELHVTAQHQQSSAVLAGAGATNHKQMRQALAGESKPLEGLVEGLDALGFTECDSHQQEATISDSLLTQHGSSSTAVGADATAAHALVFGSMPPDFVANASATNSQDAAVLHTVQASSYLAGAGTAPPGLLQPPPPPFPEHPHLHHQTHTQSPNASLPQHLQPPQVAPHQPHLLQGPMLPAYMGPQCAAIHHMQKIQQLQGLPTPHVWTPAGGPPPPPPSYARDQPLHVGVPGVIADPGTLADMGAVDQYPAAQQLPTVPRPPPPPPRLSPQQQQQQQHLEGPSPAQQVLPQTAALLDATAVSSSTAGTWRVSSTLPPNTALVLGGSTINCSSCTVSSSSKAAADTAVNATAPSAAATAMAASSKQQHAADTQSLSSPNSVPLVLPASRGQSNNATPGQTPVNSGQTPVNSSQTSAGMWYHMEYGMLVRNYRSHSRLLELPSRLFYQGSLQACADKQKVAPPSWSYLQTTKDSTTDDACDADGEVQHDGLSVVRDGRSGSQYATPSNVDGSTSMAAAYATAAGGTAADVCADIEDSVTLLPTNTLFFGVRGQQFQESDAPSYFNPLEASTLVDLVESLLTAPAAGGARARPVTADDIGVMATYRKQVQKIRLLLRERGLGQIRVGTVDDYQGQEERIVFISTVLSKPESLPDEAVAVATAAAAREGEDLHIGFWQNPKRFNVAITRAKALLVVVGSPLVLMKDSNWRELLRFCAAR